MSEIAAAQARQLVALRSQVTALTNQMNNWAIATAFCANAMVNATPVPIMGGKVGIPKDVFRDLPRSIKVQMVGVKAREAPEEEGGEEGEEREMVLIVIEPREDSNGVVPVQRAGLVLP